mmetsp:Transcript_4682/g.7099  ORF Transcript_4682/g.7099 Transcript_4682/m.7099 type:complete len:234 (-) Transcript_4682:189-890(-)
MSVKYISILSTILLMSLAEAFVPCDISSTRISVGRHNTHRQRLNAVADPPSIPADDKEKNKRKKDLPSDDDDSDWTPTKGGFIANLTTKRKAAPAERALTVDNIQDYKAEVVDEKERLVVVRFYASWCRSCKASEPLFKKLMNTHSPDLKFVQVPLTKETAYLHEGLGVPSFPFAHIYHPDAGLVEEMKISKPYFREFKDCLNSYAVGSCELAYDDDASGASGSPVESIGDFQ